MRGRAEGDSTSWKWWGKCVHGERLTEWVSKQNLMEKIIEMKVGAYYISAGPTQFLIIPSHVDTC